MILEAVMLQVRPGLEAEYERTFRQASSIISSMNGYIKHELQRCMEVKGRYLLLVEWESLEDHMLDFGSQRNISNGNGCFTIFTTCFRQLSISKKSTWSSM